MLVIKPRVPIAPGKIINYRDIEDITLQSKGLSSHVAIGYRAKTISVDSVSAVNYLIKPLDRVDVIGTFTFPNARNDRDIDTITLTILQSVLVLATGSDTAQSFDGSGRSYSTVTLQLTPEEVEMIDFASQKGMLSLSLRNPEDSAMTSKLQSVNFKYLQEHLKDYNKKRETRLQDGRR